MIVATDPRRELAQVAPERLQDPAAPGWSQLPRGSTIGRAAISAWFGRFGPTGMHGEIVSEIRRDTQREFSRQPAAEPHAATEQRLLDLAGAERDLFGDRAARLADAYRQRAQAVAARLKA